MSKIGKKKKNDLTKAFPPAKPTTSKARQVGGGATDANKRFTPKQVVKPSTAKKSTSEEPQIVKRIRMSPSLRRAIAAKRKLNSSDQDTDALVYADPLMADLHEGISDLAALGLVDATVLKEFADAALIPSRSFKPEELKALRERERVSQVVFAHYLGVSTNTISQWERGERRAVGAAAKLLTLVEAHGLAYIR